MDKQDWTEYPRVRPWLERASSLQYIPMGSVGLVASLRAILQAIVDGVPTFSPVPTPGSRDTVTIDSACVRIRTTGLVRKEEGAWALTREALRWLKTGDNLYLAAILCANVRFMGEQLARMGKPISERDLLRIAVDQYDMEWKTSEQIRARDDWFRSLDIVSHIEHAHQYVLTDTGRQLLNLIVVATPADIARERRDHEIASLKPSDWAVSLCKLTEDALRARPTSIGYICGPSALITSTLSSTITYLEMPRSLEEFNDHMMSAYDCNRSSAQSYRSTLRVLHLLDDCPEGVCASDAALKWNEQANPTNLACYIHSVRRCVFELLAILRDAPKSRRELSDIAIARYRIKLSRDNLGKRIDILKNAGLVTGNRLLALTEAGENLLDIVSTEKGRFGVAAVEGKAPTPINADSALAELCTELHSASRDSDHPKRFEKACAEAFRFLGFKSKLMGDSGEPDVMLTAQCAKRFAYKVTVEAKSSKHPAIPIGNIDFLSIREHRIAEDADYAIVIAQDFSEGKMVSRAEDKRTKAALLKVDTLCTILEKHAEAPLAPKDYMPLFESGGFASAEVLAPRRNEIIRHAAIMRGVMGCLISESNESSSNGFIAPANVYYWLKSRAAADQANIAPSLAEVDEMLKLLSSKIIGCVEEHGGAYRAVGTLTEAKDRFSYLSRVCAD